MVIYLARRIMARNTGQIWVIREGMFGLPGRESSFMGFGALLTGHS